jgi:glutaredoxin
MTVVTVYSRPECHLCAEAISALIALHGEGYRFDLHEVDIESDDLLLKRLLETIPVVEIDGEVVSELILDERAVREGLLRSRKEREGPSSANPSLSREARSGRSG